MSNHVKIPSQYIECLFYIYLYSGSLYHNKHQNHLHGLVFAWVTHGAASSRPSVSLKTTPLPSPTATTELPSPVLLHLRSACSLPSSRPVTLPACEPSHQPDQRPSRHAPDASTPARYQGQRYHRTKLPISCVVSNHLLSVWTLTVLRNMNNCCCSNEMCWMPVLCII